MQTSTWKAGTIQVQTQHVGIRRVPSKFVAEPYAGLRARFVSAFRVRATQQEPVVSTCEANAQKQEGTSDMQEHAASTDDASFVLKSMEAEMSEETEASISSPAVALASMLGIVLLLGGGYLLKDQVKGFLDFFIAAVEDWGPWGYFAYAGAYTALEILAVPAIPLTMTAGVIFGPVLGTAIVSASGTLAATVAFLIARYAARDKILQFAKRNRKFAAIDKAIGRDGFKFVTLLRLSPLFPLAASNYLYGLTSVDLGPYVLGSFLGMLPGTYAYVSAGHVGKAVFVEGEGSISPELWQVALGLGVTVVALGFVGQLAKKAIDEVDADKTDADKS